MNNLIVIFICLVGGIVIRRAAGLDRSGAKIIGLVVLWMSLPALILSELPPLFHRLAGPTVELVAPAALAWLIFIGTALGIQILAGPMKWSRATQGGLTLAVGLGNTSFVGFPLLEAIYGKDSLPTALIIDQLGTFLVLSTLGLVTASVFAGRDLKWASVTKRVLTFPPFVAVLLSLVWWKGGWPSDGALSSALSRIGLTLTPLALISVGWQLELNLEQLRARWRDVAIGLGLRLFVWPLLIALSYRYVFDSQTLLFRVCVLEAAMAPMITGVLVAAEFDLDGELAGLLVGFGIPLSLLTVWIWSHFVLLF